MKNFTRIIIFTSLFSIAASAQTKTTSKPTAAKSIVKTAAKPAEKSAVKLSAKPSTKTAAKVDAKSTVKTASKPVEKSVAKPVMKTIVKPAAKSAEKTSVKTVKKPAEKSDIKPILKPSAKPNAPATIRLTNKPAIDKGEISDRTYTNRTFNFEITLPDEWIIPGDDFEKIAREQGFDLNLQTPKAVNPLVQTKLNQTASRISVLFNAFKSVAGTDETAILRVSVEDLRILPQVKDAVDYFDLMRETYKNIKLPADFKYSETQAERLGKMQFAFLDTANGAGKKRMYATVRSSYAVMFTLTYKSAEDLTAIKNALAAGNFRLK